ncbi:MAG: hypothetical protein JRI68_31205 [Deltaproteobacteria bacterium]|nr:hypothetical protein [Deltaproteobacteria bacterium]
MTLWVTIRSFDFPHEAELARITLESSGVEARLRDLETVSTLSHLGPALGGVKLDVREEDAELAWELLEAEEVKPAPKLGPHRRAAELEEDSTDEDWDDEDSTDEDWDDEDWDDEGLDDDEDFELTDEMRLARREEALELPGDPIAARAYNAALLGLLLCPGIAHAYSLLEVAEIREKKLELTERGERHQRRAIVIDLVALAAVVVVLVSQLIPW